MPNPTKNNSEQGGQTELDKVLDSALWAFRSYGNVNGFKDQNAYAKEEVNKIKQFFAQQQSILLEKVKEIVKEAKEYDALLQSLEALGENK